LRLAKQKTGQVLVRTSGRGKPTDLRPGNRLFRKDRTGIGPHPRLRKAQWFQSWKSAIQKKPDRYWSATQVAESPVISVPEIGYVRRSEFGPWIALTTQYCRRRWLTCRGGRHCQFLSQLASAAR